MKSFGHYYRLTYPAFLGYISVGFIFGAVAVQTGLPPLFSVAASLFLYAGAAQFLLLTLIQGYAPWLDVLVGTGMLNSRHLFYFKPVEGKIAPQGPKRWYTVLALTDECFALISDPKIQPHETWIVAAFCQSYWVLGTALGAYGGGALLGNLRGLDFALVALFTVLAIEKLRWTEDRIVLAFSFAVAVSVWFLLPHSIFLLVALALS